MASATELEGASVAVEREVNENKVDKMGLGAPMPSSSAKGLEGATEFVVVAGRSAGAAVVGAGRLSVLTGGSTV